MLIYLILILKLLIELDTKLKLDQYAKIARLELNGSLKINIENFVVVHVRILTSLKLYKKKQYKNMDLHLIDKNSRKQ